MAVTYTEQYEIKKAFVEMALSDGMYQIDYIASGPIDGSPTEVNATVTLKTEEQNTRVAYASYSKGTTSVRFDTGYTTTVSNQAVISSQFYNDLQSILVQ